VTPLLTLLPWAPGLHHVSLWRTFQIQTITVGVVRILLEDLQSDLTLIHRSVTVGCPLEEYGRVDNFLEVKVISSTL
jgi:hypothetical protein